MSHNELRTFLIQENEVPALEHLDVSNNELPSFESVLLKRTEIKVILMRNNRIRRISSVTNDRDYLGPNLDLLAIDNNPLICDCELSALLSLLPFTAKIEGTCSGKDSRKISKSGNTG